MAAVFDNMSATSVVAFSDSVAALWKLLLSCLTKTRVASFQCEAFYKKACLRKSGDPHLFSLYSFATKKGESRIIRCIIMNP